MTAHRAKRKRWTDLIALLEAMEAGAVPFEDGSRKVIELARDLGIADHDYVRPFYGAPTQRNAVSAEAAGMASAMIQQATPKLLRYARDHAI
jgi:DICT domain-containing protein